MEITVLANGKKASMGFAVGNKVEGMVQNMKFIGNITDLYELGGTIRADIRIGSNGRVISSFPLKILKKIEVKTTDIKQNEQEKNDTEK